MKFGKALAALEDAKAVRRARWAIYQRLDLRDGAIYVTDDKGASRQWVVTQADILADDWMLVPSDVSMSKQKETTP